MASLSHPTHVQSDTGLEGCLLCHEPWEKLEQPCRYVTLERSLWEKLVKAFEEVQKW